MAADEAIGPIGPGFVPALRMVMDLPLRAAEDSVAEFGTVQVRGSTASGCLSPAKRRSIFAIFPDSDSFMAPARALES